MSKRSAAIDIGNVFNIQRFSIQDGPGSRITVFLKGYPTTGTGRISMSYLRERILS
jgi:hypothetical protein